MSKIAIIPIIIILGSCTTIWENRDACPNVLHLSGIEPISLLSIGNDKAVIDSCHFEYKTHNDTCNLKIISYNGNNTNRKESTLTLISNSNNSDKLYYYSSFYYFKNTRYISDTANYEPLFLSFDINLIGKAEKNDTTNYSIYSEIIGYSIDKTPIYGEHQVSDLHNIVVLRSYNNSKLLLKIQISNPHFQTEYLEFDLNQYIVKNRHKYTIDINNNTGQILSLTY